MKSIAVYCGSMCPDEKYQRLAYRVGQLIARAGWRLVNGGGSMGLMAATIDGCLAEGGKVTGVIPEFMDSRGWAHKGLTEKILTPDMGSRKRLMEELTQGAIALPGGIGTLDELTQVMTQRQLDIYPFPVVVLNYEDFYRPFIEMMNVMAQTRFLRNNMELFHACATAEEAVNFIVNNKNAHN